MGVSVIVHGFIKTLGLSIDERTQRLHRHNCEVIGALPEFDDEWPFLTRSMFSLPYLAVRRKLHSAFRTIESVVIAFGGSYKNLFVLDADWIRKFEQLLSRLCWDEAYVYNQFSGISYLWEVAMDDTLRNHAQDTPCRRRSGRSSASG